MKPINQITLFTLLLTALCGCEAPSITSQQPSSPANPLTQGSARTGVGDISNGPSLPAPTISKQTYVPANDLWAETRCRAWRITWPTYPTGTDPKLMPTMFSVKDGIAYSFNFLNNTAAATTYKTDFNLYHDKKVASVYDMWSELTHVLGGSDQLERTFFNKSKFSATTIEGWVKGRPNLFELYWEHTNDTVTEIENYKQGDIYQFHLVNQNRYGGIRIVSMSPRIIEVYLAEPNY
ncbi:hypothetical protein GCM10027592_58600 [Spirosoma flavus]